MKNGSVKTCIADTTVSALDIRVGWRRKSPLHEKSFESYRLQWAECKGLGLRLSPPSPKGGTRKRLVGGLMATTAKRNYKKEYQTQLARGDDKGQIERQRARRMYDKEGIKRDGKNIDHIKPIKSGGLSTKGNLRLRSAKANKSDNKK